MEIEINKNIKLIDAHTHLNDEKFLGREEEIIKESKKYGIEYFVCAGFDLSSSKKAVELAEKYSEVYALVGLHPDQADKYSESDLEEIEELAKHKKVVGIGEIGLDHYWEKDIEIHKKQIELFIKQINIANKYNLPINIHTREATMDTIKILKENKVEAGGIIHCCPLNEYLVKECVKLGYYISFAGVVTFKNADPVLSVRAVPDDKLLTETDAPYLAPVPNRGKENIPGYSYYTAEKISYIREIDFEILAKKLYENTKRIYYKLPR